MAVHPTRKYFAVGEECPTGPPNIYIYEYPGLLPVMQLSGGTERAYSALCFTPNGDGSVLASVGAAPDFMLTLWHWPSASIMLRSKAFSQEVYTVSFSKVSIGLQSGVRGLDVDVCCIVTAPVGSYVAASRLSGSW